MSDPHRPRYRLELVSLPGQEVPAARRLAQVLKSTLRAHGFRCVRVEEVTETAAEAPGVAQDATEGQG